MAKRLLAAAVMCLVAAGLATPGVAATQPAADHTWRWRTPLGTFELDPQARQRLEDLQRTLGETARELRALLEEKSKLSPQQEERLRRLLDRLREQLKPLQEGQPQKGPQAGPEEAPEQCSETAPARPTGPRG